MKIFIIKDVKSFRFCRKYLSYFRRVILNIIKSINIYLSIHRHSSFDWEIIDKLVPNNLLEKIESNIT